ncbi:MAG TPA: DISARM system helicase DrmA, partial [Acidobacteriota bacterium]|nr:DISARM system helicase DrmA [Acidobacteriota bacterium]
EPDQLGDRTWIFQPQLIIESGDEPGAPVFTRRGHSGFSESRFNPTDEAQMVRMAYRSQVEFAVGHNVGVHWECLPDDPQRATRVMTAVVPRYEVPKTTPPTVEEIPALQGLELDMKVLAELSGTELVKRLAPVTGAYRQWIHDQAARIDDPAANLEEFRETARLALENCSRALTRIQEGITLLQTDPVAAEAFRFANQAMYRQRVHSLYAERKRQGKEVTLSEVDIPANHRWFPFQMAFMLLNLPGLTQLDHPDRTGEAQATADLLWFPTGGGKTEAYLGLTAYVLGLRRLQGEIEGRTGDYGVAVLMRYTLRLLTLQQFQRASALICACESIRREAIEAKNTQWGQEPFRIGLWVGQKTTPNHTEDSKAYVDRSQFQSGQSSSSTPHQLTNCPWCGEKINPGKDIKVEPYPNGRARTFIFCGDKLGRCLFSSRRSPDEGIPILVVDEEIYRRLPALLIATVDKFAQMPWEGRTQMLFGQVDSYCPRHGFRSPEVNDSSLHPAKGGMPAVKAVPVRPLRPPDLIIQDELHLISGPLGTLVGLYETAVDRLASWEVNGKRVYPKVVASTATIRQAREQVHGVFLRQVQIFPPQGLDAADNFFSRQRPPCETTPGRVYLGFCAPGKRLKIALIRTYIALLAGSQYLYEKYGSQADPWMTLVGYFNSVRELAGMRRVTDDDVVSRLKRMDRRGLAKRLKLAVEELTSRRTSTEIPMILDRLETVFDPQRQKENEARRKIGQPPIGSEPIDVLLATNMISVGVDVKRLGALVTAGQPKTTAEYIQATSRVGRSFPGLVVTVYNWARPRDLSHYEKFEQYHATFYEHVEALSVTPFATGAIKRGLSALLVSLIRLAGQELNANEQAFRIERHHPSVQKAIETIIQRAWAVGGAQVRDQVEREIAAKLDFWLDQARVRAGGVQLAYEDTRDGTSKGLLRDPSGLQWEEFTTLRSLRNVEPTINLVLDDRQL